MLFTRVQNVAYTSRTSKVDERCHTSLPAPLGSCATSPGIISTADSCRQMADGVGSGLLSGASARFPTRQSPDVGGIAWSD